MKFFGEKAGSARGSNGDTKDLKVRGSIAGKAIGFANQIFSIACEVYL